MLSPGITTFTATEIIPAGARVKFTAGSATAVELADSTDTEIGTAILHSGKSSYAAGEGVGVKLINDPGTRTLIAAGSYAAGAVLYRANDGKVDDSGTDDFGYAMEASTADGDLVEGLHVPAMTDATPADGSVTVNKIGSDAVTTVKILDANVTGAKLSAAANLRSIIIPLGTIATTGATTVTVPVPTTGTLVAVKFLGKDVLATSDTNYLTFAITNKGTGAGTTAMLSATATGTTKVTGGAAIAAYTTRNCPLHATGGNAALTANDALEISVTATGTLANTVTEASIRLDFTFTT